ncbi:MAG TPA: DUF6476 family protein [Rhodopila sp.]|uniref:DUF6476 family protein n=1 Tax=Rhodopila sp. TaxID=2480087 RepID=UPI002C19F953|nr:DUF6476 family protein [Rhodopila sp.]HVY17883.1 DUF6476 family protein [Rhodopila sp.]
MRALKIATVVMGVLIVGGTIVLLVALARRGSAPSVPVPIPAPAHVAVTLPEPEGTRIVSVTATQDRLAVQLQGGGPDRILLLDPRSGAVAGRISLAH